MLYKFSLYQVPNFPRSKKGQTMLEFRMWPNKDFANTDFHHLKSHPRPPYLITTPTRTPHNTGITVRWLPNIAAAFVFEFVLPSIPS